jgi:hypothetical protein
MLGLPELLDRSSTARTNVHEVARIELPNLAIERARPLDVAKSKEVVDRARVDVETVLG